MGFLNFLQPVEHAAQKAGSGTLNFLKSTATGLINTGKNTVDIANAARQGTQGLIQAGTAAVTHNPVAEQNAITKTNKAVDYSLGASRGAYTPEEAQSGAILKPIVRNAAAVAPVVVPFGKVAEGASLPLKFLVKGGTNAAVGGGAIAASEQIDQGKINAADVAKGTALGAGLSALDIAAPLVIKGARVSFNNRPLLDEAGAKEFTIGKGENAQKVLPEDHPTIQDGITQLAKSNSEAEVRKIMQGTPQFIVDRVAPAIANSTKDPYVIKGILSKATDAYKASIAPPVSAPVPNTAPTPNLSTTSPSPTNPISTDPVQRIVDSLNQHNIKGLQEQQQGLYSTERSARLAQASNITEGGRAGTYAQLGALKGKLPTVDTSALKDHLNNTVSPDDVNSILDTLRTSPNLKGFEPITAQNSIVKLFDEGKLPTPGEFDILQKSLGQDFTDSLKSTAIDSMSNWQKIKNFGVQVLGAPKAVMASFDLSGGGRQGAVLGSRFLPEWLNAQKAAAKSFASKKAGEQYVQQIAASPNAAAYKAMDLNLINLGDHEEAFPSQIAEKIPIAGKGVAASDRAYTIGLSVQRTGVADHIIKDLNDAGIDFNTLSTKAQKDIGRFINTASGRGDLGSLEKHAQSLGEALFSPRLWKSRLDMLNPIYYAKLDPIARKYALQSASSFASIAGAVLSLAALAGAQVETDPRSSDFLKIKIGDTRYDILGGFQQNLVLADRLIFGQKKNSLTGNVTNLDSGKFGTANRLSVLTDFIQNKENPVFAAGQHILAGTDKAGNKVNPLTEVGKLAVPLGFQDTFNAANDLSGNQFHLSNPSTYANLGKSVPESLVKATIPGTAGVGVGTYGLNNLKPTPVQQKYIDKITSNGASKDQINAVTNFYQYKKSAPSRTDAGTAIKAALKAGNQQKAIQLAKDYNAKYKAIFSPWAKQYGSKYGNDGQLIKDYQSGFFTDDTLTTYLDNIQKGV